MKRVVQSTSPLAATLLLKYVMQRLALQCASLPSNVRPSHAVRASHAARASAGVMDAAGRTSLPAYSAPWAAV